MRGFVSRGETIGIGFGCTLHSILYSYKQHEGVLVLEGHFNF